MKILKNTVVSLRYELFDASGDLLEKTEDPIYVQENNTPIDYLYYYIHQLQSPLESLFDILIGPERCKKLLYNRVSFIEAKKKEKNDISNHKRIKDKNQDIRSFFVR